MKKRNVIFLGLTMAFTLLMSLPWLVPHMGWTALFGLVPLLIMERLATAWGVKRFFWWHYLAFVLWNAVTTWWVAGATVGGAVFAILANAIQMSVVFESFRIVKRRISGVLPYIYLAAAWLAWEKYYLTVAQISWPWLVLGNAFADTVGLVQWYSVLGHLGGSLWVLASNLAVFGLMVALSDGRMGRWNAKARIAAIIGVVSAVLGPMIWSACLRWEDPADAPSLQVMAGQPNLDPYEKFGALTQEQQDARFLNLLDSAGVPSGPCLVLAPETFTGHFMLDNVRGQKSFRRYQSWLREHPDATLIFGASAYDVSVSYSAPSILSYDQGKADSEGRHLWLTSHNTAVVTDTSGRYELFHKSKLVVGTELTPYPKFFVPLEKLFGGNLMGKCVGQKEISCLHMRVGEEVIPIGTAICYESVYGEYCTGYVRAGAKLLTVITNDAWWGNTPGYRQHFSYSCLRAIETRRYIARCGNTGISAVIDPSGRVLDRTPWWRQAVLSGSVKLLDGETFFVRYGDIVGRVSVFLFLLLAAAALFRPRRH
ncbi:MAG: apolipoprotein N-acyltransferase [Bacteroidales bacterium]|nr:apolipoprotein N-acyltransferase [Bacteroidales bacterium]